MVDEELTQAEPVSGTASSTTTAADVATENSAPTNAESNGATDISMSDVNKTENDNDSDKEKLKLNKEDEPLKQNGTPSSRASIEPIAVTQTAEAVVSNGIDPVSLGDPTRVWINQKITPALLEAMRWVTNKKPENPVKALGEYLIDYAEKHEKND